MLSKRERPVRVGRNAGNRTTIVDRAGDGGGAAADDARANAEKVDEEMLNRARASVRKNRRAQVERSASSRGATLKTATTISKTIVRANLAKLAGATQRQIGTKPNLRRSSTTVTTGMITTAMISNMPRFTTMTTMAGK
jgi:hypothetical protein